MKVTLAATGCIALLSISASQQSSMNDPIQRVVIMIGNVAKTAEEEGKKEEELYETYVCFAKKTVDSKTESNTAAEGRINEMKQYIADIDAGRIEMTSEQKDLIKDLAGINEDIESSEALREKGQADFEMAKEEILKATASLTDALDVLNKVLPKPKQGALFTQQERSAIAAQSDSTSTARLQGAIVLGDRFLSKRSALFLRRLLSGKLPKADWSKRHRYDPRMTPRRDRMTPKARAGKIIDVLTSMKSTFEANLEEATSKEEEAKSSHGKLMEGKKEQRKTAEQDLATMSKENGDRGMGKEEAQAEVDALTKQIADDTKYIKQAETSLADKKKEWKVRQALRAAEIAALSKAISILSADDARDLLSRASARDFLFLQTSDSNSRASRAATILRDAGRDHKARLMALAVRASTRSHFKDVVAAIDKMIGGLNEETGQDETIKEECESTRASDARKAALLSRDIDGMTDLIATQQSETERPKGMIADNEQKIKATRTNLAEYTTMREAETAEFKKESQENADIHALLLGAIKVLKDFYSENDLVLMQTSAHDPGVPAGEAPPPPPATWEAPYGGKTSASTGIIAILTMCAEDLEKTIKAGQEDEEKAQARFVEQKKTMEKEIADVQKIIVQNNEALAATEVSIQSNKGDKRTKKNELGSLMSTIAKATPNCDYFAVNYAWRTKNRITEIDGLQKAKSVMLGAKFENVA